MAFAEKKVGLIIQAVIEDVGELYLGLWSFLPFSSCFFLFSLGM
jgi:hypothetical protein